MQVVGPVKKLVCTSGVSHCRLIETRYDGEKGLKMLGLQLTDGRKIQLGMTASELNTLVFHLQALQGGNHALTPVEL